MHEWFNKGSKVIDKLEENGYEAYFVGGAIRDYLLGREVGDVDINTSALPDAVMKLFEKTIPVGLQHGTVIVVVDGESFEVTTFRKEDEYSDHRRPDSVEFVDSLIEDLKRRDFTMNAIAMDRNGNVIDPFNGKEAIKEKVIRTVGSPDERFTEDSLRMMRALRFHSQLSFEIDRETKKAMTTHASLLQHVSIERITVEFEKMIKGPSCHSAMELLHNTSLFNFILDLHKYEKALVKWPKLDYFEINSRSELWSLICLLLGVTDSTAFLRQWKLPVAVIKDVQMITKGMMEIQKDGWTPYGMYRFGKEMTKSIACVHSILYNLPVNERIHHVLDEFSKLPVASRGEIVIDGHDLLKWGNKQPGPWIQEIMISIEMEIVNGSLNNDRDEIKEWLLRCNRL